MKEARTELGDNAIAAGLNGLKRRIRVAVGAAIPDARRIRLAVRSACKVGIWPERRDLVLGQCGDVSRVLSTPRSRRGRESERYSEHSDEHGGLEDRGHGVRE